MTRRQFAALIGFAFVAAWIGFGFADAVLCALGALAFGYAAESDFGELQARLMPRARDFDPPSVTQVRPRRVR